MKLVLCYTINDIEMYLCSFVYNRTQEFFISMLAPPKNRKSINALKAGANLFVFLMFLFLHNFCESDATQHLHHLMIQHNILTHSDSDSYDPMFGERRINSCGVPPSLSIDLTQ